MTDFQFPSMENIRRRNTLCIKRAKKDDRWKRLDYARRTTKSPIVDDWVELCPREAEGYDVVGDTWVVLNHELQANDWVVVNRPSPFRVWLANIFQKKNI